MGTDQGLIEEVQRCRSDKGLSLVHIAAESGLKPEVMATVKRFAAELASKGMHG